MIPHMYMISNWKVFAIKQIRFTNLSEYILNIFGAISILIKDLTTNFLRSRDMVEFNIERPGKWKVRGQIVDKIDFDPKT